MSPNDKHIEKKPEGGKVTRRKITSILRVRVHFDRWLDLLYERETTVIIFGCWVEKSLTFLRKATAAPFKDFVNAYVRISRAFKAKTFSQKVVSVLVFVVFCAALCLAFHGWVGFWHGLHAFFDTFRLHTGLPPATGSLLLILFLLLSIRRWLEQFKCEDHLCSTVERRSCALLLFTNFHVARRLRS